MSEHSREPPPTSGTAKGRAPEVSRPLSELTWRATRGVIASIGQNVGTRAMGFVAQILLAKLLAPSDFGMIGLALTVNAIIQPLMDFGIEDVLVARRKSFHLWIGTAYTLSVALGTVGALTLLVLAPVAALFYHAPELNGLLAVMALAAGLYGFTVVPEAKLRTELRFTVISNYALAEMLGVQSLTLMLAWAGAGAYAFVLPFPLAAITRVLTLQAYAQVRFRSTFRLRRWAALMSKGFLVFCQRIIQVVREQGDYCLLGLAAGPEVVGAYFLAFRLAAQPVYTLIRSISVVLFPTLSHVSGDPEHQTLYAIQAARLLALVVTPLSFLLAAVAEPIVTIAFGPKWLASVPYLQWLSVGLAFDVVPSVAGSLANARGWFPLQLKLSVATTLLFLLSIVTGLSIYGALGVAYGVVVTFVSASLTYAVAIFRPVRNRWSTLLRLWIEPAALSGMAIGAALLTSHLVVGQNPGLQIAFVPIITLTIYLAGLVVCAPDLVRQVVGYVTASRTTRARLDRFPASTES